MPPEQLTGEEVDDRNDFLSMGVMLVEAITGSRPFSGRTHLELLDSILRKPYHLEGSEIEVKRLDELLQICLAKDRKLRYSTAAEVQKELIPALQPFPPVLPESPIHQLTL